MTALAFLMATGWRPERGARLGWWPWLAWAAFCVALGAFLGEVVAE